MKRAVVIGLGSIGQRHVRILKSLGYDVVAVSKRDDLAIKTYSCIVQCVGDFTPNLVIIANETILHKNTLLSLNKLNFQGKLLIEKPLFSDFNEDDVKALLPVVKNNTSVGYNLRFHPLTRKLVEILDKEEILFANFYCGSYLPDWRKEQDYRLSYSCERKRGGGVLRDLSHELDLASHLLGDQVGEPRALVSGHGVLGKDVEESASLLMRYERCHHVNVSMNYWDRAHRREITLLTKNGSYLADYSKGRLFHDNKVINEYSVERDEAYEMQVLDLVNSGEIGCSFEQGTQLLRLINRIEQVAVGRDE
jgi:predicted dehydrogenase